MPERPTRTKSRALVGEVDSGPVQCKARKAQSICRVRVSSGEVKMTHNGGISEEEIAEGYVLSCCSEVCGNVEIEY